MMVLDDLTVVYHTVTDGRLSTGKVLLGSMSGVDLIEKYKVLEQARMADYDETALPDKALMLVYVGDDSLFMGICPVTGGGSIVAGVYSDGAVRWSEVMAMFNWPDMLFTELNTDLVIPTKKDSGGLLDVSVFGYNPHVFDAPGREFGVLTIPELTRINDAQYANGGLVS